jgi:hypothetical protein
MRAALWETDVEQYVESRHDHRFVATAGGRTSDTGISRNFGGVGRNRMTNRFPLSASSRKDV